MMRIDKAVVNRLKMLKGVRGIKCSHQELVDMLVCAELKKVFVDTEDGYAGVGAVVSDEYGHVSVIADVNEDKITFRDGSSILNGGKVSRQLKMLAKSIELYNGGLKGE